MLVVFCVIVNIMILLLVYILSFFLRSTNFTIFVGH